MRDWGFMPIDPDQLRVQLDQRGLKMLGSWVNVNFNIYNSPRLKQRQTWTAGFGSSWRIPTEYIPSSRAAEQSAGRKRRFSHVPVLE